MEVLRSGTVFVRCGNISEATISGLSFNVRMKDVHSVQVKVVHI